MLDDTVIPYNKSINNLGMTINQTLNWTEHVTTVCKKVNNRLHPLKRLRSIFPRSLKLRLVQTLLFPLFDYCDIVLIDATKELNMKLQRTQNTCLRYALDLPYYAHISPFYKDLSCLRIEERRRLHATTMMYQLLTEHTPVYLSSNFRHLNFSHQHATRSGSSLEIPKHRTAIYNHSFKVTSCRWWNDTPKDVRDSRSLTIFRSSYSHFLLSTAS